jgi:hypothetical protein
MSSGMPTPSNSEAAFAQYPTTDQQQQQQAGQSEPAAADEANGGSDGAAATVAASRPRRAIKMPQRLVNSAAMADRDGHDMVRCEGYPVGPPGCGVPGAQPFRVAVSPM